jgi:hypothetical protein
MRELLTLKQAATQTCSNVQPAKVLLAALLRKPDNLVSSVQIADPSINRTNSCATILAHTKLSIVNPVVLGSPICANQLYSLHPRSCHIPAI